jgi:hypothetical protein
MKDEEFEESPLDGGHCVVKGERERFGMLLREER